MGPFIRKWSLDYQGPTYFLKLAAHSITEAEKPQNGPTHHGPIQQLNLVI